MHLTKYKNIIKFILITIFLLVALIASASLVKVKAYNLPEMGSSTDITLTPKNEKLLGEEIFHDIKQQLPIVEDPYLQNYIQNLGNKLLQNSGSNYNNFHFFIVDSPTINAFALPGGFIGVNKGLITTADNESEIAAVLAHEITHVTQRHIARSFEKSQQMQMPMIAGIITGALLAAYNPELGQSIVIGSMAAGNQSLINYTREHETEADRIGIATLAKSGYPANSMIEFFSKLQTHAPADPNLYPEYLRTHPLTENRIADARSRVQQIKEENNKNIANQNKNNIGLSEFNIVKNILIINSSENFIKTTNQNLESSKTPNLEKTKIDQYKFNSAYALIKQHKHQEANKILQKLSEEYPNNIHITSLLAQSYQQNERKAMSVLERQLKQTPDNIPLNLQYYRIAINTDYIKSAIRNLKRLAAEHKEAYPEIDLLLADAYNKTGNKWHASLAYADYSIKKGDYKSAITQLKATTKFDELNNHQKKITDYRIKNLEKLYKYRKEKIKELL